MRLRLLATTSTAALLYMVPPAQAGTIVASIYGSYDAECGININCTLGTGLSLVNTTTNPSLNYGEYDTPSLFITNPTAYAFTGVTLTATGYQGINNGKVETISLPTIAPGEILDVTWSNGYAYTNAGDLFNYDYDDSYFQTTSNPACAPEGYTFCAKVGNFDVKFAATWNGQAIASDFSPDNTQDGGNQQGTFVGWEGVDPNGYAESIYDNHSGSTPGVLAYIYLGTTGVQTSTVPEPGALSLLGASLGALALTRRRRKSANLA
jgi:hypothetical protein